MKKPSLMTPDGRYIVVDSLLWRASRADLPEPERAKLVRELMSARRAVRDAGADDFAVGEARRRVHDAKVALGERGPVWWDDGSPDFTRHAVKNTPYAAWYAELDRQAMKTQP